jgi:hypothetical protein
LAKKKQLTTAHEAVLSCAKQVAVPKGKMYNLHLSLYNGGKIHNIDIYI